MVSYSSLAAVAQRLIDENGRDITITLKDRAAANPSEPWRANGSSDTVVGPVRAVVVPYSTQDVDGTLVQREDKRALVAALDVDPSVLENFDLVTDGSDVWRVVASRIVNPGDTRVIYALQLRR